MRLRVRVIHSLRKLEGLDQQYVLYAIKFQVSNLIVSSLSWVFVKVLR